ncbi:hypothetical protein ACHQM5_017405 [Ranunculus cassubicifolius]
MSKVFGYSVLMFFLFLRVSSLVKGHEEKISSVVVKGKVVCKACFDVEHGLHILPASGAVVAISCRNGKKMMKIQNRTNQYGDFIIELPSHLHGVHHLEKACVVKVLKLSQNSPCRLPIRRLKKIKLLSNRNNVRAYTIGTIRLQHTSNHAPKCLLKQTDVEDTTWKSQ